MINLKICLVSTTTSTKFTRFGPRVEPADGPRGETFMISVKTWRALSERIDDNIGSLERLFRS